MGFLMFHNNNNKSSKPWSTKSLPNPQSQVLHSVSRREAKQRLNSCAALLQSGREHGGPTQRTVRLFGHSKLESDGTQELLTQLCDIKWSRKVNF